MMTRRRKWKEKQKQPQPSEPLSPIAHQRNPPTTSAHVIYVSPLCPYSSLRFLSSSCSCSPRSASARPAYARRATTTAAKRPRPSSSAATVCATTRGYTPACAARATSCRATAATEADRFASAMVYAHAADARATDLVLALVHDEVQSVPGETQLFRGNSLASKAFRAYSRMVGLDYLWMTLARFVHKLSHLADVQDQATRDESRRCHTKSSGTVELEESSGMHDTGGTTTTTTTTTTTSGVSILSTEFEVDPTKLAAGADEETQSYMLAQRARQLVVCIVQSTPHLPAELRFVAHRLAQEVGARFPGCERIAIGGTFFLRFICPALLAPHCYALLMTPDRRRPVVPGDHLQRQLVLLGKVLQNLANGVLFGKKEPFMVRMNQFITRNLDTVGQWMDAISSDATPCREAAADVPRATLADSHKFLLAHVAANLGKIQASLEQAAAPPELFASLRDLVQA